jgi:hypothetical protein
MPNKNGKKNEPRLRVVVAASAAIAAHAALQKTTKF